MEKCKSTFLEFQFLSIPPANSTELECLVGLVSGFTDFSLGKVRTPSTLLKNLLSASRRADQCQKTEALSRSLTYPKAALPPSAKHITASDSNSSSLCTDPVLSSTFRILSQASIIPLDSNKTGRSRKLEVETTPRNGTSPRYPRNGVYAILSGT